MNEKRFIQLVTKYLSDEISNAEKTELNEYLKIPKYSDRFNSLKLKWNESDEPNSDIEFNLDKGLNTLRRKIEKYENISQYVSIDKKKYSSLKNINILKIAASIAVFIIISVLVINHLGNKQTISLTDWDEKITLLGQKSVISFMDGSKITLNGGTILKYPKQFSENIREVFLEGEAFFEIYHDSQRPFVVYSGKSTTTVLGTKFNVKSFQEEDELIISLVEGSIKVDNKYSDILLHEVVLEENKQYMIDKISGNGKIKEFNLLQEIGWKENILIFDEIPLTNVFNRLSRAYGIEFELEDNSLKTQKLTAKFDNEEIGIVINIIQKLTKLEYKTIEKDDRVTKIIFQKQLSDRTI